MPRRDEQLKFDLSQRRVYLRGQCLTLQDKAWQVLVLLARRAPATVTREEIVEDVWQGNFPVGDKGLNQALWAIRNVLGDDARLPRYIQTLPRVGYRWLQRPLRSSRGISSRPGFRALAAGLTTLALILAASPVDNQRLYSLPSQCEPVNQSDVAAYRRGGSVFIDFAAGCRLVVQPSGAKRFGDPLVSNDGQSVAFAVFEKQSCHLVTLLLQDGEHKDFGDCPG